MEPESNKASPITNEPTPSAPPAAEASAPVTPPVTEAPVSAPVAAAPQDVPQTPPMTGTAPTGMPPVMSTGSDASLPSSGSGKSIAVTLLILSLLAGGAAAAYYYWMNMNAAPAVGLQGTEAATSTENPLANTTDPALRPALEGVILSLNAALATSSYEAFVQTIASTSASQITKADFQKSAALLKANMIIDLPKTDFINLKTEGIYAGYYFLLPTPATSTRKILGMVSFVQEATGWKIANLFNKEVDMSADMNQIVNTDPDFSFSTQLMTDTTAAQGN